MTLAYKNQEGYADPTAGKAVAAVRTEERDIEQSNHQLIQLLKEMANAVGFEIVGRVTLKHKKTGRVFK